MKFTVEGLKVKSDLTALTQIHLWFEEVCQNNIPQPNRLEQQLYRLNLALTEGFTNAVRHAHHNLPTETPIELELSIWEHRIEIRIWDEGEPFDPDILEEPEPGTLREGGYGWFLLRRLADYVVYKRCPEGRNCLLISSLI